MNNLNYSKSQPNSKKQSEVSTSQSAQQEVFKQEYINSYLKTNNPKFFFKNEPPKFNFGTNAKWSKKGESYLSNDFSKVYKLNFDFIPFQLLISDKE